MAHLDEPTFGSEAAHWLRLALYCFERLPHAGRNPRSTHS